MFTNLRKRPKDADFRSDENYVGTTDSRQPTLAWKILRLGTSAACGAVFGFCLEKGRVFEPAIIRDQMLFRRFVMLKMFLAASATSMFSFSILAMIPSTSVRLARAKQVFISGLCNKGVLSSVVGGAILGAGMTLSGACPGMVLAQVGAGVSGAVSTLLGGMFGAALYGMVEPTITRATQPTVPIQKHYLNQHLGGPYFALALPFVAVLGMGIFAVELYSPWTSEVPVMGEGVFTAFSWPPYLSGILIGLIQVPLVLFHCDTMGSSSSYCTVVSMLLLRCSSYLAKFSFGIDNWWQVVYVGGAVGGAYLSSSLSAPGRVIEGVDPRVAFLGGALMLFGSRLAAGCTSGHGLSGVGLLSVLSMIAVPAMFAGGMATAFALNSL